MNEKAKELAREQNLYLDRENTQQPLYVLKPEELEAYYHATRAALIKELLAGVGEPVAHLYEDNEGGHEYLAVGDKGGFGTFAVYTPDQMAAAVLRQREKDAALCESEAWRLKKIAVDTNSKATNSKAIQAYECAAAIRGQSND